MKFLLYIALIAAFAFQVQAFYRSNDYFDDESSNSSDSTALERCEEQICSRIYRPLCISIDGVQTSVPSRCHMNKLRCKAKIRNAKKSKNSRTIIRVVHNGNCFETKKRRQNSKKMNFPEEKKKKGRN